MKGGVIQIILKIQKEHDNKKLLGIHILTSKL